MKETSDEQIDRAWVAFYKAYHNHDGSHEACVKAGLRAIAAYLQMPWDDLSEDEVDLCTAFAGLGGREWVRAVIGRFVAHRNAQLLPKEEDPRREVVRKAIWQTVPGIEDNSYARKMVDRILAALDSMKEEK